MPGTTGADIMGCYTPDTLPILSGLARGYAVCDQWFCSAPTETLPNRAFVNAGTSQGHMDDKTHTFTSPSIYGLLGKNDLGWAVYGYSKQPLTKNTFTDIAGAPASNFGLFTDFQAAAAAGTLGAFTFLEPSWGSKGNSQHPNYDVALGEQLIHDVYYALRNGPGWDQTLLVITYDEHGGCYDHVPAPVGSGPPGCRRRRVRLRLHPLRPKGPHRPGLPPDPRRHRLPSPRGRHPAGPHLNPENHRDPLGPTGSDRPRRGSPRRVGGVHPWPPPAPTTPCRV